MNYIKMIITLLLWCFIHILPINSDLDVIYRSNDYIKCSREISNLMSSKTSGDNGFKIKITGKKEKFKPGGLYTGK